MFVVYLKEYLEEIEICSDGVETIHGLDDILVVGRRGVLVCIVGGVIEVLCVAICVREASAVENRGVMGIYVLLDGPRVGANS